jgi:hypothetical protein
MTRQGYELMLEPKAELVNQSDQYGDTLIEAFFRGVDVSIVMDGLEYGVAGTPTAIWPWGTLGQMGIIARALSGIAGSMVLTATAGTPAASSPATLTGAQTVMAPGSQTGLRFTSQLRNVPVRFVLLPSATTHFSTT